MKENEPTLIYLYNWRQAIEFSNYRAFSRRHVSSVIGSDTNLPEIDLIHCSGRPPQKFLTVPVTSRTISHASSRLMLW